VDGFFSRSDYRQPAIYQLSNGFYKTATVSFVIPNLKDDMHNGSIQQGDSWLQTNLLAYANWAINNNSLLIVTFDEDNGTKANQIATIFVGPMVKPGQYNEKINHYNVLRTIEDMYGLGYLGKSASATPITDVWQ
jgi:acid phosphatase